MNESETSTQPAANQPTAPSFIEKKAPHLIVVTAGAISIGFATLLIRWWVRGVWDFTNAISLGLIIFAFSSFGSLRRQKRFTLGSVMWLILLLAIGFAGLRYSMELTVARDRRVADVTERLQAMVSNDGVFVEKNGDLTCLIEDPKFSIRDFEDLLQVVDDSPEVRLSFLGMFTSQASDDWLTAMGARPRLRRVLVDRNLVSEKAITKFQRLNSKCEIDLNVVAQ